MQAALLATQRVFLRVWLLRRWRAWLLVRRMPSPKIRLAVLLAALLSAELRAVFVPGVVQVSMVFC